jgi:IS1 family transposase
LGVNKVPADRQAKIVACLCEGNSLRSTSRLTDTAINTVMSLQVRLGEACAKYQDEVFRELSCKRLQCDETWGFVYSKEKNVPAEEKGNGKGDAWTWIAIDTETKLIPSWRVGGRGAKDAQLFMEDLASRLTNRVQMVTDGHKSYIQAVEDAFGTDIDYAQLVKIYGTTPEDNRERYIGAEKKTVFGKPDHDHTATGYIERANLTFRMSNRRHTRKTNAFSKKLHNHKCATALFMMYYNFARIHKTLRVTPAMEAGLTDHVWSYDEIVGLLDSGLSQKLAA